MGIDDFFMFFCLGGIGIVLFLLGILSRLGYFRWIYAMKGYPVVMPHSLALVLTPIGLIAMFLGVIPMLPLAKEVRLNLGVYLFIPLLIVTYILAMWSPWWLKPKWLRWLEKEHSDILDILWEDVRQDRWGWERRVRTQEGLEAWVAEVREKNNL